jgi:hypothetical protein
VIEECGYSLCDADGGENAGTEQGVAAKTIVEGVEGARDVCMNPREIRELFEGESRDWSFVAFPYPFEGQVVAVGVEGVRGRIVTLLGPTKKCLLRGRMARVCGRPQTST